VKFWRAKTYAVSTTKLKFVWKCGLAFWLHQWQITSPQLHNLWTVHTSKQPDA